MTVNITDISMFKTELDCLKKIIDSMTPMFPLGTALKHRLSDYSNRKIVLNLS